MMRIPRLIGILSMLLLNIWLLVCLQPLFPAIAEIQFIIERYDGSYELIA